MADDAAKRASTGREIQWLGEVDSTNRRLAGLGRDMGGAAYGLVIVADHQTAGRGRRGRTWEAPPGSSLLVSAVALAPATELAQLTTVGAALAAADACEEQAGVRPALKWPNDLMIGSHKLGGILAEALPAPAFSARSASSQPPISGPITTRAAHQSADPERHGSGFVPVVVGLGLNVDWGNVDLPGGATSLDRIAGARRATREALLASYLHQLEDRCQALTDARTRAGLLDDYRANCSTLGRMVRVELGAQGVTGTATDITGRGNLVVTTNAGAIELSAGDIFHIENP